MGGPVLVDGACCSHGHIDIENWAFGCCNIHPWFQIVLPHYCDREVPSFWVSSQTLQQAKRWNALLLHLPYRYLGECLWCRSWSWAEMQSYWARGYWQCSILKCREQYVLYMTSNQLSSHSGQCHQHVAPGSQKMPRPSEVLSYSLWPAELLEALCMFLLLTTLFEHNPALTPVAHGPLRWCQFSCQTLLGTTRILQVRGAHFSCSIQKTLWPLAASDPSSCLSDHLQQMLFLQVHKSWCNQVAK